MIKNILITEDLLGSMMLNRNTTISQQTSMR